MLSPTHLLLLLLLHLHTYTRNTFSQLPPPGAQNPYPSITTTTPPLTTMSDVSANNAGGVAFTEREMQMLAWAMQSLKSGPPEV
jgi:hypothetical protein